MSASDGTGTPKRYVGKPVGLAALVWSCWSGCLTWSGLPGLIGWSSWSGLVGCSGWSGLIWLVCLVDLAGLSDWSGSSGPQSAFGYGLGLQVSLALARRVALAG